MNISPSTLDFNNNQVNSPIVGNEAVPCSSTWLATPDDIQIENYDGDLNINNEIERCARLENEMDVLDHEYNQTDVELCSIEKEINPNEEIKIVSVKKVKRSWFGAILICHKMILGEIMSIVHYVKRVKEN